MDQRALVVTRC